MADGARASRASQDASSFQFRVEDDQIVYSRYLTLYDRVVRVSGTEEGSNPEGETRIAYDVVGHPSASFVYAICFPFNPAEEGSPARVTLIREFCQGPGCTLYNLPSGAFSPSRHSSLEDCARCELAEEAHLCGGELIPMMGAGHPGAPEVKWCRNRFVPFLVLGAQPDPEPPSRDAEEFIQICDVPLDALEGILLNGEMLAPAMAVCYMALAQLKARKEI